MFINPDRLSGENGRARKYGGQQAFTLFEVTLAMSILVLLAGALYAMVDASIRGTSELETRENRTQQLGGFLELCRKTFYSLPATALFEVRIVQQGENYGPELVFRNSPRLFSWGDEKNATSTTILGVRSQVGGLFSLSILQDSEKEIGSYLNGGTAKRPWLVLVPDLRKVEWRFYEPNAGIWMSDWKDTALRPAFAELTLTTEEGAGKYVFWLPPIQREGVTLP
ncbi:MAG: prepilin-type N-terminal cleavage/methylation domain-containing protein [Chthoniobacteraceae bacterium]